MRQFVVLLCVLCGLTAGALAAPQALVLNDATLVAVRPVAQWLGADVQYDADTHTVTLQRAGVRVAIPLNRRAATLGDQPLALPVPALSSGGTTYVPVRALVAAFGVTANWTATTRALTLTQADAVPFTVTAAPFPRPACLRDDTLAGLTPGDHLALAVALWGDPTSEGKSVVPGARDFLFAIDKGIQLLIISRADEIVAIHVSLTGDVPLADVSHDLLLRTGTAHGLTLTAKEIPTIYRDIRFDYSHESDDVAIVNYPRASLTVVTLDTFFRDTVTLAELTLIRPTFKKEWLPMEGPR